MSKGQAMARKAAGQFGQLVRRHRERLRISITDLSRAALIDQGLLSKIERGLRPPAQFPQVQRIAERFGFDPTSKDYLELFKTAYAERFGENPAGDGALPIVRQLASRTTAPFRGLSGLPPELTQPDSAV